MRNSIAYGWQVAVRTVLLQIGTTLVVSLIATTFGWHTGLAALAGGLIVAAGNMLFAIRLFGRGVASARNVLRSRMPRSVEMAVVVLALYLAIAVLKLPFPGLIAGVLAAQLSFWIALIAIR